MDTPYYVVAATVSPGNRVKGFFQDEADSPARLLDNPLRFRHGGFDVSTLDTAKFVGGDHWEVQSPGRKLLQLYQDGTLLFRMRADAEFLGWGSQDHYFDGWINPVAAIESQASFVHLYARVLALLLRAANQVSFVLRFENGVYDGTRLAITEYRKNPMNFAVSPTPYPLHDASASTNVAVSADDLAAHPSRCAYGVVRAFYELFDAGPELIPFTATVDNQPEVDVHAIQTLR